MLLAGKMGNEVCVKAQSYSALPGTATVMVCPLLLLAGGKRHDRNIYLPEMKLQGTKGFVCGSM